MQVRQSFIRLMYLFHYQSKFTDIYHAWRTTTSETFRFNWAIRCDIIKNRCVYTRLEIKSWMENWEPIIFISSRSNQCEVCAGWNQITEWWFVYLHFFCLSYWHHFLWFIKISNQLKMECWKRYALGWL